MGRISRRLKPTIIKISLPPCQALLRRKSLYMNPQAGKPVLSDDAFLSEALLNLENKPTWEGVKYEQLREGTRREGSTRDTSLVRRTEQRSYAGTVRDAYASPARHGRPS
jgi:hypothetical protein